MPESKITCCQRKGYGNCFTLPDEQFFEAFQFFDRTRYACNFILNIKLHDLFSIPVTGISDIRGNSYSVTLNCGFNAGIAEMGIA